MYKTSLMRMIDVHSVYLLVSELHDGPRMRKTEFRKDESISNVIF